MTAVWRRPEPYSPAYTEQHNWLKLPAPINYRDVAGIAATSRYVFLFTRHDNQVIVVTASGELVRTFGGGLFDTPHSISVDANGDVYCTDSGDSTVRKFSPAGELLMTLGTAHEPSETGWKHREPEAVQIHDVESVLYPGPPFNGCTAVTCAPDGELYVSDGYRNCAIHRFSADGRLRGSWGEVGSGPGQFRLPHAIAVHEEQVLVADRENDRIQIFDRSGQFLEQWTDLQRPTDIAVHPDGRVFVTELWRPPGNRGFANPDEAALTDRHSRISILSPDGQVLERWGGQQDPDDGLGKVIAPHAIDIDEHGRVFVGEVVFTFAISRGLVGPEYGGHRLHLYNPAPIGTA